MRVLMVIAEFGSGGAEAVAADLSSDLLAHGHAVTVATNGGWRADRLGPGADMLTVPLRGRRPDRTLAAAAAIRRQQQRLPADLVHAHNIRAAVAARLGTGGKHRPPLLATVHGLAEAEYPRAASILARCADHVVAVSPDTAERLAAAGLSRNRLHVVENAVPPAASHDRGPARQRLGLAPDAPVVLCAARLAPPKRHDLLVQAWQRMPPAATLLIAGDGPLRGRLTDAVHAAGLQDRIRLLGDRRDLAELIAAADALVLPSDREGLPMSVLEAMAAGVPVVASAVGGLVGLGPEALELVPPGSADALAAGLSRVLTDEVRARSLVHAGLALTGGRFAVERMRASYRTLYERHATTATHRGHPPRRTERSER